MIAIHLGHRGAAAAAVLGLALFATPSQAQLGGLIKKKASAVANQTTAKQVPPTPEEYTDEVLELTADRLDNLILGLEAGRRIADGTDGPAALQARREALQPERERAHSANGAAYEVWKDKNQEVETCRGEALGEARDARTEENRTSPAKMKIGMAMMQANANGDSAEVKKLNAELKRLNEPTAEDSAVVDKKCGKPTPPGAGVARLMSLEEQINALEGQIRAAEEAVAEAERKGSKMNEKQLRRAIERLKLYLSRVQAKAAQRGFSAEELKAMEERIDKLTALLG